MGDLAQYHDIIEKLTSGMEFGLFEDGRKCYFRDGTQVDYVNLWIALREVHHLRVGHNKRLSELCPDQFVGTFAGKFSKHTWKKNMLVK
jgi:hypothetical protein